MKFDFPVQYSYTWIFWEVIQALVWQGNKRERFCFQKRKLSRIWRHSRLLCTWCTEENLLPLVIFLVPPLKCFNQSFQFSQRCPLPKRKRLAHPKQRFQAWQWYCTNRQSLLVNSSKCPHDQACHKILFRIFDCLKLSWSMWTLLYL